MVCTGALLLRRLLSLVFGWGTPRTGLGMAIEAAHFCSAFCAKNSRSILRQPVVHAPHHPPPTRSGQRQLRNPPGRGEHVLSGAAGRHHHSRHGRLVRQHGAREHMLGETTVDPSAEDADRKRTAKGRADGERDVCGILCSASLLCLCCVQTYHVLDPPDPHLQSGSWR